MRLLRVLIEDFRSIRNQWLTLHGQVILFGPNSTGKTSVLEAVQQLIGQAGTPKSDPADRTELYADGSVWFDLPGASLPGTTDAETYRTLLCGWSSEEKAWEWLSEGTSERIRTASLSEALEILVSLLVEAGSAGAEEDRELLARSILDTAVNVFITRHSGGHTQLVVQAASMPRAAMEAAERVSAGAESDDPLRDIAAGLVTNGGASVCVVADTFSSHEGISAAFPPVIVLDGDYESLSAELAKALPAIHDRLWDVHYPREPGPLGGYFQRYDHFEMAGGESSGDLYEVDPWLESLADAGNPVVPGRLGGYGHGDWFRVRHSALAVARMIEAEANRVAPSFVKDQGRIGIGMMPVSVWRSRKHRIRATFTESDGESWDLNVIGAGTARWAAADSKRAGR